MIETIYTNTPTLTKGDIFSYAKEIREQLQQPCVFGDYWKTKGTIYALGQDAETFEKWCKATDPKISYKTHKKAGTYVWEYNNGGGSVKGVAEQASKLIEGFTFHDITAKRLIEWKLGHSIDYDVDFLTPTNYERFLNYAKAPVEILCLIVKSRGFFPKSKVKMALDVIENEHGIFAATPEIKAVAPATTAKQWVKVLDTITPDERTKYAFDCLYYDKDVNKVVATDGRSLVILPNHLNIQGDSGKYTIENTPKPVEEGVFPRYQDIVPDNCTEKVSFTRKQALKWYHTTKESSKVFGHNNFVLAKLFGHYLTPELENVLLVLLKTGAEQLELHCKPNSAGTEGPVMFYAYQDGIELAKCLLMDGEEDKHFTLV